MGAFLLIVGGFLVFVIVFASGDSTVGPTTTGGQTASADPKRKQMEDYVLSGYEVTLWGGGRPFVRYYDPGAIEYGEQDIYQALFWQSQALDNGLSAEPGPYGPAEAGYRLGLICEHGLFSYPQNLDDAARYYRIARVGGHSKGDAAAKRLESAGH